MQVAAVFEDAMSSAESSWLMSMVQRSMAVRNQPGLFGWLQDEIQRFLPHQAVIAAFGDFKMGVLGFDVISTVPGVRSEILVGKQAIQPLARSVFRKWIAADQLPVTLTPAELRVDERRIVDPSLSCLAHGAKDHRGRYDALYMFLGSSELCTYKARQVSRVLMPFIDAGFRQLQDRGQKALPQNTQHGDFIDSSFAESSFGAGDGEGIFPNSSHDEPDRGVALSGRELEVMKWVRMGKTNPEIAMILSLSTFTVKNHMRRIYKKLDVLNRAQAVGLLDRMGYALGDRA
jgi:transcriptional regulator EpsA